MVISSTLITRAIEYGLNQTMTKQKSQKKTAAGRKARPEGIALNPISEGNKNFKRKSWAHWYLWNVSGEARMPFPQSCQDPQRTEMHFTSEMELHANSCAHVPRASIPTIRDNLCSTDRYLVKPDRTGLKNRRENIHKPLMLTQLMSWWFYSRPSHTAYTHVSPKCSTVPWLTVHLRRDNRGESHGQNWDWWGHTWSQDLILQENL